MKQSENRRSFLFGVGAFAAAIFIPKTPKLLFPVHNNPIVTPSDVEVLSMWTDCNRIGSGKVFFWIARVTGSPARIYMKKGSPPLHLFDFDKLVTAAEARLTTSYPVYNPGTGDCVIIPGKLKRSRDYTGDIAKGNHLSQKDFMERAWAIEKNLQEADQDESA